jgi:hypothetical protein
MVNLVKYSQILKRIKKEEGSKNLQKQSSFFCSLQVVTHLSGIMGLDQNKNSPSVWTGYFYSGVNFLFFDFDYFGSSQM